MLAVGDGALGFWAALCDVFPETREQRCWVHAPRTLDALPKRLPADAKEALRRDPRRRVPHAALEAVKSFADEFAACPKAAAKLAGQDALLCLYDIPARALDPPENHQPDRVDLLDGAASGPR